MNSRSGLPVRTTDPIDRSLRSEAVSSSSSVTMSRSMKLSGGWSKRTVKTRPWRSVSNVRGISESLLVWSRSGAARCAQRVGDSVGDSPVKLRVSVPVHGDLDDPGALARGLELREALDAHVGQPVHRGDPARVDPQRGAEERLELVAMDLVRLREELEDAAPVVVEDHDSNRGALVSDRRQPVRVVVEAEVPGDDPRGPAAGDGRADPRRDQPVDPVRAPIAQETDPLRAGREESLLV